MIITKYLDALTEAGFSYKPLWDADEPGPTRAVVRALVIYAPDKHLLTSIVIRSYMVEDHSEIAVYMCCEGDVSQDIETLRGIWSRQIRQSQSRRIAHD